LQVLTSLRKFEPIVELKLKNMSLVLDIDVKKSLFYLEGKEEGIEIGTIRIIEKMLISKTLSVKAIANSTGIDEASILSIRNRLIQEGKIVLNKKK
jgi:predicted transposase YdaD